MEGSGQKNHSAPSSPVESSTPSLSVASGVTEMTNVTTAGSISSHTDGGSLQVAAAGPAAGCLVAINAPRAQECATPLATMEAAGRVEQARSNELGHIEVEVGQ